MGENMPLGFNTFHYARVGFLSSYYSNVLFVSGAVVNEDVLTTRTGVTNHYHFCFIETWVSSLVRLRAVVHSKG